MDAETQAQMFSQIGEKPQSFHFPPQWFAYQPGETFGEMRNTNKWRDWMEGQEETVGVDWLIQQANNIQDAEGSGFARVKFLAQRNTKWGQKKDAWLREQYRRGATTGDLGIKDAPEQGQADISANKLFAEYGQFLNLQYTYHFNQGTMTYNQTGEQTRIPDHMMKRYQEHQQWKET